MQVRKAVIPVAGLGTRMLPATKSVAKEMLPVVDKPLIQYVVEECAAAGITEVVLVTHASKAAIENHFDMNVELETSLEEKGKDTLLAAVRNACPAGVKVVSVRQGKAEGLGHAVGCARDVVGDEPFAVILPDVLIDENEANPARDNLAAMIKRFEQTGASQVMVEPVPMEQVSAYGVVDMAGAGLHPGESVGMCAVVEKPSIEAAPSNLSVVGRYVLPAAIWDLIEQTPRGAGNEIQLTDSIALLMKLSKVEAFHIQGLSHDCGNKLGYMKTCLTYALRHPDVGPGLTEHVQNLY